MAPHLAGTGRIEHRLPRSRMVGGATNDRPITECTEGREKIYFPAMEKNYPIVGRLLLFCRRLHCVHDVCGYLEARAGRIRKWPPSGVILTNDRHSGYFTFCGSGLGRLVIIGRCLRGFVFYCADRSNLVFQKEYAPGTMERRGCALHHRFRRGTDPGADRGRLACRYHREPLGKSVGGRFGVVSRWWFCFLSAANLFTAGGQGALIKSRFHAFTGANFTHPGKYAILPTLTTSSIST